MPSTTKTTVHVEPLSIVQIGTKSQQSKNLVVGRYMYEREADKAIVVGVKVAPTLRAYASQEYMKLDVPVLEALLDYAKTGTTGDLNFSHEWYPQDLP